METKQEGELQQIVEAKDSCMSVDSYSSLTCKLFKLQHKFFNLQMNLCVRDWLTGAMTYSMGYMLTALSEA